MRGLYLHIPFCNSLCKFCDFPKRINQTNELKEAYIKKIITDLRQLDKSLVFDTIYIGGGTPNALNDTLLEGLLKEINTIPKSPNYEYTIECNYELITENQAKLFNKYGINRISIGIQTFNQKIGHLINRISDYQLCYKKLELLIKHNLTNINADFIFGLPFQNIAMVKEDLMLIKTLPLTHLSYYSLILEDKSVLGIENGQNKLSFADIDELADMYELVQKEVQEMGFKQYEISNFSTQGFESKHNMLYWQLEDYYGIGMSAASLINNQRYQNSMLINEYLRNENITICDTNAGEYFWLGLRLTDGVSLSKYQEKYNQNPYEKYPIQKLIDLGLVEIIEDKIRLTPFGLDHGNEVFEHFI